MAKRCNRPHKGQASILGRARATRSIQPNFRRRIGGRRNRKPRTFRVITLRANSETRGARSLRPRPTASPVDNRLRGLSARTSRSSRSTYRKSSSAIVSDRETASERKIQNGNDLAAKGAFPAWIRGGVRLHAIVGAGAVGGRSTGGHRAAAAPAEATGTHGMQRRQGRRTHRTSDAMAAMSDGTRDAPVNLRPPQQLQRNSGPWSSALKRPIARSDELGIAYALGGLRNERDRRRKEKEETKVPRSPQNSRESIL